MTKFYAFFPTLKRLIFYRLMFIGLMIIYSCHTSKNEGLISIDINTPYPGSTIEHEPFEKYILTGYGTEFGCHEAACSGRFVYAEITGDFEVYCQISNVASSIGHCAAAGIMARVSTDKESPFVKVVANSHNSVWKEYDPFVMGVRYKAGGHLPQDDSWLGGYWYCIPENMVNKDIKFPACWLRLVRKNNVFTAYFAQTIDVPTEEQWEETQFSFAFGGGPKGPTFVDKDYVFPKKILVGICLEANVEGDAKNMSFAAFRHIHGLKPKAE